MALAPVSSSRLAATYTPSMSVQQQQQAKPPQKAPVKDIVTISKQAQQLATDGDPRAQEVRESGAQKSSETLRRKI